MSRKPIVRNRDPVMGHREPLPHDAPVGAVQPKRHLHVVGAIFGNEPEDVTDLVHCLCDDVLARGAGIQPHEPVGRDDRAEPTDRETDAEVAPVVVQIRMGHHDIVVRRKLLPRLVVEQLHEMAAVELAVVPTGVARMRKIPVDAVPAGERVARAPTRIPPDAEVVDPDFGGEVRSQKDCGHAIEDCLEM